MRSTDTRSDTGLFCYGTLLEERVLRAVTGRDFPCREAMLPGYRRRRLRNVDYPGIVMDAREQTDGMLITGLDDPAWAALDRFEGEQYQRERVEVVSGGAVVEAWTYVLSPQHHDQLTDEHWDLERFRAHFLQRFMFTYPNF